MAVNLSNVAAQVLPATVSQPIFDQTATETSAVMQLARRVPLSVNAQTAIPVMMDVPEAGWVGEGGVKPVGGAGVGVKIMTGKKVALLLPVSQEIVMSNPAGLYDQLRQDLPPALGRAFDYAAIHGLDRRTGATGPFGAGLKQGVPSIELGTTSQASGGMYTDLVLGEKSVTDAGFDFTGFAADPRLKPTLKMGTDTQGRPLWVDAPSQGLGNGGGTLIGYPASYNRGVSGSYRRSGNRVQVITITGTPTGGTFTISGNGQSQQVAYNAASSTVQTAVRALGGAFSNATVSGSAGGPYTATLGVVGVTTGPLSVSGAGLTGGTNANAVVAQTPTQDTRLRAIGGDWSQCAWGQGMDITFKVSDQASYVDEAGVTHSAFQENLVLLLVEAYYGFVKSDNAPSAFVAYTDLV